MKKVFFLTMKMIFRQYVFETETFGETLSQFKTIQTNILPTVSAPIQQKLQGNLQSAMTFKVGVS